MDGPTKAIRPLITDALPSLIQLLKDPSITIKDTTAWTISKICQFHPEGIGQHLPVLVKALVESLGDDPRVSSHVCWVLFTTNIRLFFCIISQYFLLSISISMEN
jgi:importin subunit beta-1